MVKPTDFGVCVSDYFTKHLVGVRNLSSNTVKSYRDTFYLLLLYLSDELRMKVENTHLSCITDKTIYGFLDWLENSRGNSTSTRNVRLAAIHAFYRYALMQYPEMLLVCQRILAIPQKEAIRAAVNYLSEDILKELLSLPDQSNRYGMRDTALMCLLYDSGARVQEIIDLSLLDVRLETLPTVRLLGKGKKVRIVPLMNQTAGILKKYLLAWDFSATIKPDDPLFVNHQGNRLTRPGITYVLNKYMSQIASQTNQKPLTPHILRHSKAMHLLRAEVNLNYIRDFLGHVHTDTTEIYARADAETKRKALEKASPDLCLKGKTSWQKNNSLMTWLQSL